MALNLLQKRRSIRQYLKKSVEKEKIDSLIEAALRAPSSRNLEPWEFIVVTDPKPLQKLSQAKQHGSAFLKSAPLAIVVCADPQKCDVWIEDTAIASICIQLTAEALGLGSCWIQIRERMHSNKLTAERFIAQTLKIPRRLKVESIIAVGYAKKKRKPRKKQSLKIKQVWQEIYGSTR